MSLTLERMRYWLRKGLGGLDTDDLSDEDADELLNMSLWSLEDRFPFKDKECLVTAPTVAGTRSYDVPNNLDAIRSVSIVTDEGEYEYLEEMTVEWLEDNAADDEDNKRAQPQRWLRRDDSLVLHPIPDDVYTIRLEMWKTVASLVNTSDTPDLPRNWHEIVVEGAITRGQYYNQDYNLAQQAEGFRLGHERGAVLKTAKEEEGARHAGLDVLWDDPS